MAMRLQDYLHANPADFLGHGLETVGAELQVQPLAAAHPFPITAQPFAVSPEQSTSAVPSVQANGTTTSALPTQFSIAQWNAIQNAVQKAFAGISGGETADQIDQQINSALLSTGLFTPDELGIIAQGEQGAEPHGGSFLEKGKSPAPFIASWVSNIQTAVMSWLAGNVAATPPPGSGGGSPSDGGVVVGSPPLGTDPGNIAGLIGALTAPISAPSLPSSSPVVYPTSGGTTGAASSPLGLAMLLGGLGLGVYWYLHHRHVAHEHEAHEER